MSERWNYLLKVAINSHDDNLRRVVRRADNVHGNFAQRSIEDLKINFGAIKNSVEAERKRFKEEIRRVASWENDPPVWVRNYGANRRYHGSPSCGWVSDSQWRVEEMLLGEAEAAGIPPCISCGHRAARAHPAAA